MHNLEQFLVDVRGFLCVRWLFRRSNFICDVEEILDHSVKRWSVPLDVMEALDPVEYMKLQAVCTFASLEASVIQSNWWHRVLYICRSYCYYYFRFVTAYDDAGICITKVWVTSHSLGTSTYHLFSFIVFYPWSIHSIRAVPRSATFWISSTFIVIPNVLRFSSWLLGIVPKAPATSIIIIIIIIIIPAIKAEVVYCWHLLVCLLVHEQDDAKSSHVFQQTLYGYELLLLFWVDPTQNGRMTAIFNFRYPVLHITYFHQHSSICSVLLYAVTIWQMMMKIKDSKF